MTLLLTRLIVAALIAAPILISCPCSSGQENQPYEVAVLDVQKVMDSIEDLPAVDIKAQWDAYKIIQRATGVLAKAKGIKFVLRVDTTNLEEKTLLDVPRIDNADMNPVVYRTRMDLTDLVIEAIQSDDNLERIAKMQVESEDKRVVAFIDVDHVLNSMPNLKANLDSIEKPAEDDEKAQQEYRKKQDEARNAAKRMVEQTTAEVGLAYGIGFIAIGGRSKVEDVLPEDAKLAIENQIVYHRQIDLTNLVLGKLKQKQ